MAVIEVHHPLLQAIREFDRDAAARFPAEFDQGLGQMGLLLSSHITYGGYWCTPLNSLSFGHTGGDGVHFSFIVEGASVTESSPVIVTCPAASDMNSEVVADNLFNFLRTGLRGGFAVHEAIGTFLSSGKNPCAEYRLSGNAARIRDFLAERFDLTPLNYSFEEQKSLQSTYGSQLLYPPFPSGA